MLHPKPTLILGLAHLRNLRDLSVLVDDAEGVVALDVVEWLLELAVHACHERTQTWYCGGECVALVRVNIDEYC